MTLPEIIRDVQESLGIEADGIAGPVTWQAIHQRICGVPRAIQPVSEAVDKRSAKNIATLHPQVAFLAERLVRQATAQGIDVRVICGLRTFEEQEEIYARGRTKPGKIATLARGGQSWHNYGLAFDIGVFSPAGDYLDESPNYAAAGRIGEILGLEWGGRWTRIPDAPHFQWRPPWAIGLSDSAVLAELNRTRSRGVRPA